MPHFNRLFAWIEGRWWGGRFLLVPDLPHAGCDTNAANIGTFFGNLTSDVTIFALAMAGFFFALAALFYMSAGATGNERTRTHAISSLYAALGGLALALLSGSIAAIITSAVPNFANPCS
jgi:hypothetical protein